jgi:hypothetical protein
VEGLHEPGVPKEEIDMIKYLWKSKTPPSQVNSYKSSSEEAFPSYL